MNEGLFVQALVKIYTDELKAFLKELIQTVWGFNDMTDAAVSCRSFNTLWYESLTNKVLLITTKDGGSKARNDCLHNSASSWIH